MHDWKVRTGQTRGVQIHVFSALDTIEQGQYKALMKKDAEQKKVSSIDKIELFIFAYVKYNSYIVETIADRN